MRTPLTQWTAELDDRLCAWVELDRYTFGQIANLMGFDSRNIVTSRWRRIVARMGYQASWPTPAGPGEFPRAGHEYQ